LPSEKINKDCAHQIFSEKNIDCVAAATSNELLQDLTTMGTDTYQKVEQWQLP